MGLTSPERVFSIRKGSSFDTGLSSNDSRTIKCGKDDDLVSVSDSLSEYERLEDFCEAMSEAENAYSSGTPGSAFLTMRITV